MTPAAAAEEEMKPGGPLKRSPNIQETKPLPTRVEAPPQRRPGLVVLPQVAQVPVALVLHQTDHLLIWRQEKNFSRQT